MEENWPQVPDAYALPFDEFLRMREYLEEKALGPEFMESPEADLVLKIRKDRERTYIRAVHGDW